MKKITTSIAVAAFFALFFAGQYSSAQSLSAPSSVIPAQSQVVNPEYALGTGISSPCSPELKNELEIKLKEKYPEAIEVIECATKTGEAGIRFRAAPIQSSAGNSYDRYSVAEVNSARTVITLSADVAKERLIALLNVIESDSTYLALVSMVNSPRRSVVTAGGIVVNIESSGGASLYYAATSPTDFRGWKKTSTETLAITAPPISSLNLALAARALTDFSVPQNNPPPTQPTISPASTSSPAISRTSNPAFKNCDPSTLRPTAYGERSSAVINLQSCLISFGYPLSAGATGFYGNQTIAAAVKFYREQLNYTWHGRKFGPMGIKGLQDIAKVAR